MTYLFLVILKPCYKEIAANLFPYPSKTVGNIIKVWWKRNFLILTYLFLVILKPCCKEIAASFSGFPIILHCLGLKTTTCNSMGIHIIWINQKIKKRQKSILTRAFLCCKANWKLQPMHYRRRLMKSKLPIPNSLLIHVLRSVQRFFSFQSLSKDFVNYTCTVNILTFLTLVACQKGLDKL